MIVLLGLLLIAVGVFVPMEALIGAGAALCVADTIYGHFTEAREG
jgi:hypothetical protein